MFYIFIWNNILDEITVVVILFGLLNLIKSDNSK